MEEELTVRALWLAYIGKYTQDKIAQFLNISRAKVQRLIANGIAQEFVAVQICHEIGTLIEIEEEVKSKFGIEHCQVVPRMPGKTCAETYMESLGLAGSTYLFNLLSGPEKKTIGMGMGRTLLHVAKHFQKRNDTHLNNHKFIPLIGSFTKKSAMNPMNLMYLLGEKTTAETYFLPAPFFVDSVEERKILEKQRSVKNVLDLALKADHYFIGIGEIGPTSALLKYGLISKKLQNQLRSKGAVAEIVGKFINKKGKLVDHPINQLSITIPIETLRDKSAVAVCSGLEKVIAIQTVLKKKLISGLITDEDTAGRLLKVS
jgi:DNA-binding transcriptional regulator LsrR (DeoR family)